MVSYDAPLINTIGLSKRYKGRMVVQQAEFQVYPGDVFGLLGPNGAGKTTIIRMLLGLVKPTLGKAVLFGEDVQTNRKAILRRTAAIVEAPALYPYMTGRDNLKVMALSAGVSNFARIDLVLSQMGLAQRANDKFRTYSLGMKQRLCIAATLLADPQLIILDEPTNGLDPAGIHDIRELIKTLAQQGRTVLVSSHLLGEIQQVCNRVAIIQNGQIITQGLVEQMLANHSYIQIRVAPTQLDQARAALSQLSEVTGLSQDGDYLIVEGQANQGALFNYTLGTAGIFASEIIVRSQSLEEYFLSVTSQPASAKVPAASLPFNTLPPALG